MWNILVYDTFCCTRGGGGGPGSQFFSLESHPTITFTTVWANSADDKLVMIFLFFPEMFNPFSGKNKNNISKCRLMKILSRVPCVKTLQFALYSGGN